MTTAHRSGRVRLRIVLLVLLLLIVLVGAWVWQRAGTAPSWYAPRDGDDPRTVVLAERVEYRVVEEIQRVRPEEEPWTVRLREEQVNAWLAARLPDWIAHEQDIAWPDRLGTPQVHVAEDGVSIALPMRVGERMQVLSTRVQPEVADGHLRLRLDRVGIGRMTLPGSPVEKLREVVEQVAPYGVFDDPSAQRILDVLSGAEPVDALLDLADGRRVELLDLLLGDGAIDLTSRTAPP